MATKLSQARVVYLPLANSKADPVHVVILPWVETSGHPKCPASWNNGAHAAAHSLLAALKCDDIESVRTWLQDARRQVNTALSQARRPHAKVPAERPTAWSGVATALAKSKRRD
jgi:hypothetical protein